MNKILPTAAVPAREFTRREFLSTGLKAGAAAVGMHLFPTLRASAAADSNVLLILVDDMRPWFGCYGHPEVHTPNIDALAARGTVFNRAYCQYPLCSPSRQSLITGLRPDTIGVTTNTDFFRAIVPGLVTLPQHFKAHGYHTQGIGKIAHAPIYNDDASSWSVSSWRPRWSAVNPEYRVSWSALDVADDVPNDGQTAARAVEVLSDIRDNRFFLAVGFRKPHFPLDAPRKYFDLYDPNDLSLPATAHPPQDSPSSARTNWGILRRFADLPDGTDPLSDAKILEIRHAYVACISYIDAQIGNVLRQLNALGLEKNTVVVFCGDHGHHLGDHGILGKDTLFDAAVRSPLIVSVPGQPHAGATTNAPVELVDVYPTLCDACQLPTPPALEGLSMMPVIQDPESAWKAGAFSQYNRGRTAGISIRTERYRYTEWGEEGNSGMELYDYETDPDETVNVAGRQENAEIVSQLRGQLRAGWQAALPGVPPQIPIPEAFPYDINGDGVVDIRDLVLISNNFGKTTAATENLDINGDGDVDILDLLLTGVRLGLNAPAAPMEPRLARAAATHDSLTGRELTSVEAWIAEARLAEDGSALFRDGIAALERLLETALPVATALLPNYPNPFNPETWIPYDLAEGTAVDISIWDVSGEQVRRLSLGFQTAGSYRRRGRAAYWDGRNASGEPVASGLYFYTLHAGDMRITRQMVIVK